MKVRQRKQKQAGNSNTGDETLPSPQISVLANTFDVEFGGRFVRATVTRVLSDVGLLCLPDRQNALFAIGDDGDVLRRSQLFPVLEPLNVGDGLAQLTPQFHLVLLHSCVILQLGGEVEVPLCRKTREVKGQTAGFKRPKSKSFLFK